MNYSLIQKAFARYRFAVLFILTVIFLFNSCQEEPKLWKIDASDQVVGDYIATNPDFSEFSKLVDLTGLTALLKIRGPYTIMLPNNDAMFAYYKKKNVSKLEDFDARTLASLVRNHLIADEITTGDIGLGALRDTNAIGDYLVTEFEGSDIILNKYAKIIKRDIRCANGYIDVLNNVIDPVVKDVYNVLASDPSFSIFSEGLRITKLKDTLQIITFPYGKRTARTRFTMFAVPDTIYQRYGINNVGDLVKWCGANPDSVTYLNNPFYRYMEYHCLNGTHYLSDLNSQLYPILSRDNNISITVDTDYKINLDSKTKKYTGFNVPSSNTPAKNGAVHAINNLLPVTQPEPSVITCETTDYFDIQQGDYIGKYYMKWHDGKNTFEKIKWEGDYLLYYYKPNHGRTPILHNDCLSMLGFWWLEITTPKIMKGHYKVSANVWTGGDDLPIFDVYIDGVRTANNINARISSTKMDFGEETWTTTAEHKIRLVCTGWGVIFWDTVVFTPTN